MIPSLNNEIKFALLAIGFLIAGCVSPSVRERTGTLKLTQPTLVPNQPADASVHEALQPILPAVAIYPHQPGSELPNTGIVQSAAVPQFSLAADVPTVGNLHAQSVAVTSGDTAITIARQQAEEIQAKPVPQSSNPSGPSTVQGQSLALPMAAANRNAQNPEWMEQYIIETGDQLDIKFRTTHELNDLVTVRPDGMISMQIVGDVQAAGLTPEQLRQDLIAAYSANLKNPDLAVIVRSFSGNSIYVGGEVTAPGRMPLSGRITTLRAIILAGGFKDTANQRRVIVRRADGSCCTYDLKSFIECKSQGADIQLRPNDVVYVPKSCIAKVNLFVEQYIDKVLPFSRSYGVFVTPNSGLSAATSGP